MKRSTGVRRIGFVRRCLRSIGTARQSRMSKLPVISRVSAVEESRIPLYDCPD